MGVNLMRDNLFISNFKIIIKRSIIIILIILSAIWLLSRYFKLTAYPRDSMYMLNNYIEENTIDVLCVGSSHIFCTINPVQMYRDYGIAAYDLTGGRQAPWYSYYYIQEAIKTQAPEVVILDVYTSRHNSDGFINAKVFQSNLLSMKPSLNKWHAVKASGAENKFDLFWQFPITHSRYESLTKDDFNNKKNNSLLGYSYNTRVVPYEEVLDASKITESESIPVKSEEYLRKSIELCKQNNINVILFNAPWPCIDESSQRQFNYIQAIADEYEIVFLNGCLYEKEIGIDYLIDSMGDGGHLNYTGAEKCTRWLCEYLMSHYKLKDRRGETQYEEWKKKEQILDEIVLGDKIVAMSDLGEYLECLLREQNIYYIISLKGNFARENQEILKILHSKGFNIDQNGTYVMHGDKKLFYSGNEKEYDYYQYFDDSVLAVSGREDGYGNRIFFDREEYSLVENGINILVYNELLDRVIDNVAFDLTNSYNWIREKLSSS